ncbi:MAG: hypothetical protein MUC83_11060, partial [Pirellula sp.]|nr:hypothetical protein [Pirellula sp.]
FLTAASLPLLLRAILATLEVEPPAYEWSVMRPGKCVGAFDLLLHSVLLRGYTRGLIRNHPDGDPGHLYAELCHQ